MSAAVAAGWALSSDQSVSVVPTIQCRPHGMMNSTDFSVRRIMPVVDWIRSRGTTRCTPLDARTWNCPRSAISPCVSSVHTPVALTTWRARTSIVRPVARSRASTPVTRSPWRRNPVTRTRLAASAPYAVAERTSSIVWRASSICAS